MDAVCSWKPVFTFTISIWIPCHSTLVGFVLHSSWAFFLTPTPIISLKIPDPKHHLSLYSKDAAWLAPTVFLYVNQQLLLLVSTTWKSNLS